MRYKINTLLYYDATEGSLKLENSDTATQLSITANALLFFMLKNPGVIGRDEIMKRVWDDNGLVSSNSNLNQYLSILRKTFRRYDIDNIIITVTHGRLELNPDIKIELINDAPLLSTAQAHETQFPLSDKQLISSSLASRFTADRCWSYANALFLFLAITLFGWTHFTDAPLRSMKLTAIESGECELFLTDETTNAKTRKNYVENFHIVKDQKKIPCHKGESFLFFYGEKLQQKGLGRTFMAHCLMYKKNKFSYCDNYFYYSWR